jgi:hypothetical protein
MTDEPEVPDEAYIAAAIADHGFAVVRSNACGMPQARVGFKHPHLGYSSDGSVMISEERARECMPKEAAHEHDTAKPDDHPPAAELSAAEPGEAGGREWQRGLEEAIPGLHICTTEDMDGYAPPPPDPPKKLKKPRKKPTT